MTTRIITCLGSGIPNLTFTFALLEGAISKIYTWMPRHVDLQVGFDSRNDVSLFQSFWKWHTFKFCIAPRMGRRNRNMYPRSMNGSGDRQGCTPIPTHPVMGNPNVSPIARGYLWIFMGYSPQESLENTINTMGTLLGVHPIVPWMAKVYEVYGINV